MNKEQFVQRETVIRTIVGRRLSTQPAVVLTRLPNVPIDELRDDR